jgi:XTP/dITP diphosphohydrolase
MKLPETIVFATNNAHKLDEVRAMVGNRCKVLSLADIGCHDDIAETADTLEGNALIKARWVKQHYGYDCFADDTGLEVDALNGAPGVLSARYAATAGGTDHNSAANMQLLLKNLEGVTQRAARFRTAIALQINGEEHLFEGRVEGEITTQPQGDSGFGYDPVFRPLQHQRTFAQMSADEKNALSHRGRALARLMSFFDK